MSHSFNLLIKFSLTSLVLYIVMGFVYRVDTISILLTSLLLTISGYISDVYLVPRIGNVFTTISDFLLAFIVVWLVGTYVFDNGIGPQLYKSQIVPLLQIATLSSVTYSIVEWFYHKWLLKRMNLPEVYSK